MILRGVSDVYWASVLAGLFVVIVEMGMVVIGGFRCVCLGC